MTLPDFLTQDPLGEITLKGHRIGLYTVVRLHQARASREQIAEQLPTLPLELIDRVLAFYRENQEEVNAYTARCAAEIERQATLPPGPGVLKVRQRMADRPSGDANGRNGAT
jgi:uncharacterized protein (DUF433 family)